MAYTLTDFKKRYLKPGVIIIVAVAVLLIVVMVFALKPKPKDTPQPQTKLPESVNELGGKQVIPPKSQRQELNDKVKTVKQEILKSKIGEDNGTIILFRSSSYKIEYVPTPDIFLATILTE